ncbi:MAG: hypothetical protein FWE62_06655 [Firmicutes bacterium]|nr:hypothetical protein [Bacillota bacterium]
MRSKRLIILFSILAFAALFIVLNSIIFHIRDYDANCLNENSGNGARPNTGVALNTALHNRVTDSAKANISGNIFFLNVKKAVEKIQAENPNILIYGIERGFPARVTIHYVKQFEYGYYRSGNDYYRLDKDLRVIEKPDRAPDLIKITVDNNSQVTLPLKIGDSLSTDKGIAEKMISEALDALERMGYEDLYAVGLIDSIDARTETGYEGLTIKTRSGYLEEQRAKGGVTILLEGGDRIAEKLNRALSVLQQGETNRSGGTITVYYNPETGTYPTYYLPP